MRLRPLIRPKRTASPKPARIRLTCESLESREAPAANAMGINLSGVEDWSGDRLFADAMKSARRPSNYGDYQGTPPIDANGWPATDASIMVFQGIANMNGTYKLSFTGQANVSASWGGSIQNKSYNSTTNTTTADVVYTITDGNAGLQLNFGSTRSTPSSSLNTGITNIKLMRPISPGSTTSYDPSVTFTQPIENLVSDFSVVRMMDATGSNGSDVNGSWANRRVPNYASQAAVGPSKGMAWEYAIQFWNETGKDAWVNIPYTADDNYVTQLATLLKNTLNPGQKIYVEYSNELWNMYGSFPGVANRNAALAEVQANPNSPLNFDHIYPTTDPNGWELPARRIAYKTVDFSNIFRQVFGDADMMSRVRPVLMTQLGWTGGWLAKEIDYIEDYFDNSAYQSAPHPTSYYIYGAGGSAYQEPDWSIGSNITVDQIFATMPKNFGAAIQEDVNWAAAFGLKRIAYEGGPSLDNISNNPGVPTSTLEAAWNDPRMRTELVQSQNIWTANGGDLLMYFASTGGPQWGMTHDPFNQNTPKMQAIGDLYNSAAAPLTYGKLAPLDLTQDDFKIPYWQGTIDSMQANTLNKEWNGASFRVDTAGAFSVRATATASSGGKMEILVDGKSLGIIDVPANGDTATIALGTLQPGLHGIAIYARAGTFGLSKVSVVAGSSSPPVTPPPVPSAPTNMTATTASSTSINVSWSDQSNNETAFVLDRATNSAFSAGVQSFTLAANATAYADTGLTPSTTYYYRVRATNSTGSSGYSNIASATTSAGSGQNGLTATYFVNQDLTGSTLVRTDATVDFNWTGSPATGIGADHFSVRWTGTVQAIESGSYRFETLSDDGVRLWVNGTRIINNWTNHAATYNTSGNVTLVAGQRYDVKMEFYENTGAAWAQLLWRRPGQTSYAVIPQAQLYPSMPGPVLFADSFDNGLGNWGVASGSWGMYWAYGGRNTVDGGNPGTGEAVSIAATSAWADYSMAAWVNLTDLNGGLGILGRVTDSKHYYQLELKHNSSGQPSWSINKRDGSTVTQLATGLLSYTAGSWLRFRLTLNGTTLKAEYSTDGTNYSTLGTATDARYSSGKVGLRAWNSAAYFDDAVVQGA